MRSIDWLAVTFLLLFAAGLRIIGINFGHLNPEHFPSYDPFGMVHEQLPVNPDSFHNVAIPVEMALNNRLNPEFFNYPSFIINANLVMNYLTGALDDMSLADRDEMTLLNYAPFSLYVFSRIYSVFGGLLMVSCAYATSRIVCGRYAALCAGLLTATSFSLVTHAHYAKPSTLATGWMMLAMWGAIAALYAGKSYWRERLFILAGIATGLASSTYYNGVAVALIVVPVGLILLHRYRNRRMLIVIGSGFLATPLSFALTSPYVLRDFAHFWHDLSEIVGQYKVPGQAPHFSTVDHLAGLSYLLVYAALFSLGITATVFMVLSLLAGWQGRPRHQILQKNSPMLYVALIWVMIVTYSVVVLRTIRPGHSEHQLIQILPFVALLSALGAVWLVKRVPLSSRLLMPGVILLLILQPLVLSVQVVRMFSLPDTRQIMLQWIHDNVPQGARFFVNGSYNVALDPQIYSVKQHFDGYVSDLPSGDEFDYLVLSDARAYDILRSDSIVSEEIEQELRDYLNRLDAEYTRIAEIARPTWTGSESMMNMAAYYHNPALILYCLNRLSCRISP